MVDLIIPAVVERVYRDLARPRTPQPQPARVTPGPRVITLADVNDILQRKRGASAEELQDIIFRAKEFSLSDGQRNQVSVDLSILMAHRARQANGRRDDPTDEFISKVLGFSETPFGRVERGWVNAQLRAGSQAILLCKYHRPPACRCWAASRASLWQARVNGEKSPEAWAANMIYEFLTELELASRPEAYTGEAR